MPFKQKIEDEKIVEMLDSIELKSFNKSPSRRPNSDHVFKSRTALREKKAKKIENLLDAFSSDFSTPCLEHFQEFATNDGGLMKDEFRLEIWPIIAEKMPIASHLDDDTQDIYSVKSKCYLTVPNGTTAPDSRTCSESEVYDSAHSSFDSDEFNDDNFQDPTSSPASFSLEELQSHPDWGQVELDVHRTLARFPPNISGPERRQLQGDLTPMIVELLHVNESFRYYQGFHDVCLTLMLALDVDRAKKVGRHLVERGAFKNYLSKSLEESALRELQLMYVILHKCDPELERRMRHAELGTLFALSWPITWFSHSLHTFDQIALCFDLFLASDPLMPIYVAAALVEHRREEIFAVEAEMPVMHHLLSHIPESIDIEVVLKRARELYDDYRPRLIQGKLLAQYEDLCTFEGRKHLMPAANTLKRNSALQSPWLISGVAVAGVALYYWLSNYQQTFSML